MHTTVCARQDPQTHLDGGPTSCSTTPRGLQLNEAHQPFLGSRKRPEFQKALMF